MVSAAWTAPSPPRPRGERAFIGGEHGRAIGAAVPSGLKYPDRFSAIGAHSAALFERGAQGAPIGVYGAGWSRYEERAPAAIVRREGWPDGMRLFIDIGSGDFLLRGTYDFFGALLGQPNPIAEFQGRIWPGEHDWESVRARRR